MNFRNKYVLAIDQGTLAPGLSCLIIKELLLRCSEAIPTVFPETGLGRARPE